MLQNQQDAIAGNLAWSEEDFVETFKVEFCQNI